MIECRVVESYPWRRACGAEGEPRGAVARRLAHELFGHRPTTLLVRVRRYRCTGCGLVWREDTTAAALVTRSTPADALFTPERGCSPTDRSNGSRRSSLTSPRCGGSNLGHLPAHVRRLPPPDMALGKAAMQAVIDTLRTGIPDGLEELARLGRTLRQRATDVLACFDRPGTSNDATEAINGRLEHFRGSALGFRNLTNYIARSLLEAGGFRPQLHPRMQ